MELSYEILEKMLKSGKYKIKYVGDSTRYPYFIIVLKTKLFTHSVKFIFTLISIEAEIYNNFFSLISTRLVIVSDSGSYIKGDHRPCFQFDKEKQEILLNLLKDKYLASKASTKREKLKSLIIENLKNL